MHLYTFIIYFTALLCFAFITYRKQKSDTDFVIANRSLNYWLTALSAQASDMSNWLFMAFPASIFLGGIFNVWAAIGLIVMMFLNWQFVASKIRVATEKTNSLTLNAYFENRFNDSSGGLRTIASLLSILFFTFYISSGLMGLGFLVESLFNMQYVVGITVGLGIVVFYVFLGGYRTVAWIDLLQGLFLLGVILFVPIYLITSGNPIASITASMKAKGISTSLFPDFSLMTLMNIVFLAAGWGLGYFGQPHIITKFMGIRDVNKMWKAKYVGISWLILSLTGATLLGLIGIHLFSKLSNPELVVLEIVKLTLVPLFAGLVLCAILAATTNVMAAQILVVASSLAEDFYKRFLRPIASHKQVLWASRYGVILIATFAYVVAFFKISTIYKLVLYSWSGLGSSFGPILLVSLYSKKMTKREAYVGMLTGGIVAATWPYFNQFIAIEIPSMIPGFSLSLITIFISQIWRRF